LAANVALVRTRLRSVLWDVLLAIALIGLTVAALAEHRDGRVALNGAFIAVLTVAPVAVRQLAPVSTTITMLGALTGFWLFGYGDFPLNTVGMLIGMFTVATLRNRVVAAAVFAAAATVTFVGYTTASDVTASLTSMIEIILALAGAWAIGESTKMSSRRSEALAARAAQAASNERVRIAREMHDIVSHNMAIISLQAGVAEHVFDDDPDSARTAIATAAETSRDALTEMRRLLDALRVEPDLEPDVTFASGPRPQPGIGQLEELADHARSVGLPVDVSVTGQAFSLPPGPDLCAYRVVQESLTNVLKHAGPASARIEVDYGTRALTIRITDTGTRTTRTPVISSASRGIKGMRERAELYGGVLTAEAAQAGGFTVVLRLPIGAAR
jgi:signal transduction histidine kinase